MISLDLSTLAISPGPSFSNDQVMFVSKADFRRLSTTAGIKRTFTVEWLSAQWPQDGGEPKTVFIAAGDPEKDPELMNITRKLPRPPAAVQPKAMTKH